tara:strand:- start:3803 stop:4414 length:612 start_codon:yes stop_codon:yes gene_type:complete
VDYFPPIIAGIATAFIMGPVFWVLLETSITKGFGSAVAFDVGVMISDVVFIGICIFAGSKLAGAEDNEQGFYLLGGAILIVYGLILLLNKKTDKKTASKLTINKKNYFNLAVKGFALNMINVGVLLYWLTLFKTVAQDFGPSTKDHIIFFTIVLSIYFLVDLIKIVFANRFSSFLTERNSVYINIIIALILIISGIVFLIKGF